MKTKEIAYLIYRTRENTGTKVVFDHALALRQRGYTVNIYTLFGSKASWYPKGMTTASFLTYFQKNTPDVLVATFWPTAYLASLLPARKKFYLVMGLEESFHKVPILKFFARTSYRLPLQKLTVSTYLKDTIERLINKKNMVAVVRTYIPDLPMTRQQPKKRNSKTVILSVVSWYNTVKGIDLLENAVKRLKAKNPTYECILVSREVQRYSTVFDRFYSNPTKSELKKLYGQADILLATSRSEGFYIPGIEAMGNGCVFITTNSGGVYEYVKDGVNAVVLKKISDLWNKEIIKRTMRGGLKKKLIQNGYKTASYHQSYSLKDLGNDLACIFFTSSE